jgi:hypothetical protein
LIVRNSFSPDRSTIGEEWPDTLETYDAVLARVNEDFDQLDEAPRSESMWYNSSKTKFVKVIQGGTHAHTVLSKAKEFGLKKTDLVEFGVIELIEFMKKNGWARVTVISREGWFIEANTVTLAKKTAQALDQKFGKPKNIFLEHGRSSTNLSGKQLDTFLKTGKIVKLSKLAAFRDHVELDEKIRDLDKWWYDTKKRKAISIATDFHGEAVVQDPKKFGLTMSFLVSRRGLGLTQRELRGETIQALDDHLFRKGWVQVTWARNIEEVTIRGESNSEIQKTAKWFLSKINPTPAQTIIDSDTHGFDRIVGDGIDVFAKTGRVVKRTDIGSTMARFR